MFSLFFFNRMSWNPEIPGTAIPIPNVISGTFTQKSVIPPTSTTVYTFAPEDAGVWIAYAADQTNPEWSGTMTILVGANGIPLVSTQTIFGVDIALFGNKLIMSVNLDGDSVDWSLSQII